MHLLWRTGSKKAKFGSPRTTSLHVPTVAMMLSPHLNEGERMTGFFRGSCGLARALVGAGAVSLLIFAGEGQAQTVSPPSTPRRAASPVHPERSVSWPAGRASTATGTFSTAIGQNATATGVGASAFGQTTSATGTNSTAVGNVSLANATNATTVGGVSTAFGTNSTAVGQSAAAGGTLFNGLSNSGTTAIWPRRTGRRERCWADQRNGGSGQGAQANVFAGTAVGQGA